ncbi:hypothetical protein AgCh_033625 [Apium graveolens]
MLRLPTPVLDNKTPFECLYKKLPDYTQFRVFGCLCFASIHDADKFHPRAIRSVFLGYPPDHRGFKLLNITTKDVFVYRHVIFHETQFPFLDDSSTSSPTDPYFLHHWLDTPSSSVMPCLDITISTNDIVPNLESSTSVSPDVSGSSDVDSGSHFSGWHDLPPTRKLTDRDECKICKV